MNTIEDKRHTLAHLLAAAVLKLYPYAKPTLGPPIDNGFYYDFDFSDGDTPGKSELSTIENMMRKLLSTWTEMTCTETSKKDALDYFKDNQFKLELINEIISKDEKITFYTAGNFTDLCRGGHSKNPAKEITPDSFALDHIAGAYWRGDEKNPMLTRIYGLAFNTKKDLDAYHISHEEAKKRDHRKIGKEQGLFVFSDLVGVGMPLFTPKGNIIRSEIVRFSREMNTRLGFGEVHTPNINKGELFKISGHYDKYKKDMLTVKSQYVEDEMFLKPMNCPQHTQIYAATPHSYRDLPVRFADFATLYRDERPGELSGLTRLRAFSQDDGHIFCREDQVEEEIDSILTAIQEMLRVYKIEYWMRLSLRNPMQKQKYIGDDKVWNNSEAIMHTLLDKKKIHYKEAAGEAAFYGPKIDIMAIDAIGREWQISTVQLDFNMPNRFKLTYVDSDGTEKTPVMIHRALIGSPDRFMGMLIEHYAGIFPVWMSPVQVRILPISEKYVSYAKKIYTELSDAGIRIETDSADESLGKKIRRAKTEKIPYLLIVGEKEVDGNTISVESRDSGTLGAITTDTFIERITKEIKERA